MNIFSKYRRKRRERQAYELYTRGYNYAAGSLLRSEETPLSLDAKCWSNDYNDFDRGINAAIIKLRVLGIIEDDRF